MTATVLMTVGANLGQNIFHRPANSGIYAVVAGIEVSRLGFNDISQDYAIDDEERSKRYKALIESLLCTFVEPNGAMRSAQNPPSRQLRRGYQSQHKDFARANDQPTQ